MAVGRGFQGPKYDFQSQFVELPLDFMQKQLEARGKEQEKQNALVVDMLGKQIPVHNEDIYGIEHAKQLKTNLDSQLNELAGTDFTAPGSTQKILGVKSQFNKIFSQFGDADELTQRGAAIDATKKSILDAKASDQTKAYKLAQLREGIKSSPMGTKIKTPSIVNEVDVPKLMLDVAKEVVSDSKEIESLRVTDPKDALTLMSSTGKEVTVSRSKLINTLHNYFKYDPAVASTVQQQAEVFSGGDPDRYKALSNLNVIGENGAVDNNSLYGAAMEAALGAKTKRDIGVKYDYYENRQAKLEAEQAAKDANIPISTDALVQGFGSQFKTPTDIKDAVETHNLANEGIIEKAKNVRINGEKVLTLEQLRLLDYAKEGTSWAKNINSYKGTPEQKQLIMGYLAELDQNQDRINKINQIEKEAKTEAGLDNYKIPQPLEQAANNYAQSKVIELANIQKNFKEGSKAYNEYEARIEEAKANKKKYKDDYLTENDPRYKKYAEILNKNSENYTENISLTTLPTKGLQSTLAAGLKQDITEGGVTGVKTLLDKQELQTLDEYKDITDVDPASIRYYFDEGKVKLAFKPMTGTGSDKKQLNKYVTVDAPQGVLGHLLQKGQVAKNQVIAKQFLDSTKELSGSSYELPGTGLKIKSLLKSDVQTSPGSPEFEISDGKNTYRYTEDQAIQLLSK